MRIDKTELIDVGVQTANAERREAVRDTDKNLSVVRIDRSRQGKRWLEQATYGNPSREEKTSLEDIAQQAENMDAVQKKNEMLFAADHTSAKDAQGMEEDGFSLNDTEIPTVVTETDKMKLMLARAGEDISYFGDAISTAQLETASGSKALAMQISQALEEADLPATEHNISDVMETCAMMEELTAPADGSIRYMLDNGLEITTANLYKAQFSGTAAYTAGAEQIDYTALEPQMAAVIEESGLPIEEENISNCYWMIENEIPLTAENLVKLTELKELELPMKQETIIEYSVAGIAEGRGAKDAYLAISARRRLEETRLMMSIQADSRLQKQGIEMDTLGLSEFVEELKIQEQNYYQKLLMAGGIDAGEQNTAILADTSHIVEELKGMPAYAIGMRTIDETTLESLHHDGRVLKDTFEKAGERYETMMTSVRPDLGDSIQKAFRNVDAILSGLNMEINPANQRAVRILAYNQTEITAENIQRMKAADEAVQRAFANLKPAVVRQMIKEGMNPLDMSLTEINSISEQMMETQSGREEEHFSKYLWQLEQNQAISAEERDAYIGIYRLIRQVEKTDGAAIGALIQQGGDVTMRNLLSQVRSAKHGAMDYTVDDDFGGMSAKETESLSITEQIAAGYQKNCIHDVMEHITPERMRKIAQETAWMDMTPEQLKEKLAGTEDAPDAVYRYTQEQLKDMQEAATASKEVYEMLEHYDIPVTVNHVLAAAAYRKNRNGVFQEFFRMEEDMNMPEELAGIKEKILKDFGEAVKTPQAMAEAQERLAKTAEKVMKTMAADSEHVSSLDIRKMKMVMSQIALGTAAAGEEKYAVPVMVQGEMCNVSLKIVRGEKQKGLVDIVFDTEKLGRVAAEFKADRDGITGYIATDSEETGRKLADKDETFRQKLVKTEDGKADIRYVTSRNLDLEEFGRDNISQGMEEGEDKAVQTKLLYGMAESFLSVVKSLEG